MVWSLSTTGMVLADAGTRPTERRARAALANFIVDDAMEIPRSAAFRLFVRDVGW